MKKTIASVLLVVASVLVLVACNDTTTTTAGKTTTTAAATSAATTTGTSTVPTTGALLNLWSTDYEFLSNVEDFYSNYVSTSEDGSAYTLKDGTRISATVVPDTDGFYPIILDQKIEEGEVDMFLFSEDYAQKYVNSDYVVPLKDLGITSENLSKQYKYTKQVATNSDGDIVASAWNANPGVFVYNVSYAKAIFGELYSNANVSAYTDNWDDFYHLAAMVKSYSGSVNWKTALGNDANLPDSHKNGEEQTQDIAGGDLSMLAGVDDLLRVMTSDIEESMYDEATGNITVDQSLWDWVTKTAGYTFDGLFPGVDLGYQLWGEKWYEGQRFDAKVFGTFGCPWFVNDLLPISNLKENDMFEGDLNNTVKKAWNIVEAPQSFFWDGSWLAVTPDGLEKAPEAIKAIILGMTCNKEVALGISRKYGNFTNNIDAMNELAADATYKQAFTGQNVFTVYAAAAESINYVTGPYDSIIKKTFKNEMHDYFSTVYNSYSEDNPLYTSLSSAFFSFNDALREKINFNTLVSNRIEIDNIEKEE